jgi:hypothetical protein
MSLFITRCKMIPQAELETWARDYSMLKNLDANNAVPEKLVEHFEDLEQFIDKLPQKRLKLEVFINEFDILVDHFKIDTPIGREDGRPFASMISGKFDKLFARMAADSMYPPYNELFGENARGGAGNQQAEETPGTTKQSTKRAAWSDILDENTRSIYSGITYLLLILDSKITRIRQADWDPHREFHGCEQVY